MNDDAASRLYGAFLAQDPASAIAVIDAAKTSGADQTVLFDSLYVPAMAMLGGAWASGTIDEIAFTQAAVVAEQVASFVTPPAAAPDTGVVVLVGSMHRDMHSIAKNIIAAALKEAGHRVVDMGVDVRPTDIVERAEAASARIIVVCAETTATARAVSRVREMLTVSGRPDAVLLVAGGPFAADPPLAKAVGANGVVRGAESALRLVARVAADLAKGGG